MKAYTIVIKVKDNEHGKVVYDLTYEGNATLAEVFVALTFCMDDIQMATPDLDQQLAALELETDMQIIVDELIEEVNGANGKNSKD
jgi:hypothetical protein